jgi:hypothetical protein
MFLRCFLRPVRHLTYVHKINTYIMVSNTLNVLSLLYFSVRKPHKISPHILEILKRLKLLMKRVTSSRNPVC